MTGAENRSSMALGPWKLLRIIFRVALRAFLLWFLLFLLWTFLPSPVRERNDDTGAEYPTAVLRAGRVLTRVYESTLYNIKEFDGQGVRGFALHYRLDINNLTLSISGCETPLPIIYTPPVPNSSLESTQKIRVVARGGDGGGASMPWFTFADSILVSWSKGVGFKDINIPLRADWMREGEDDIVHRLDLHGGSLGGGRGERLLSLRIQGNDRATLRAITPANPQSSSPSMTYPIRAVIIQIIAPTAVFANDVIGTFIGKAFNLLFTVLGIIIFYTMCILIPLAFVVSLWRCLGGPSFETVMGRTHDFLGRYSENERYRFLRMGVVRGWLDRVNHSEKVQRALDICRNGWHPERDAARREEEEAKETDVEKGNSPISQPKVEK